MLRNRAAVEKAVRTFHERVTEVDRVIDALNQTLSMQPESDLCSSVWAVVGGWIEALGAAYFIDSSLEWWWLECRLGRRPMQAGLAGEELRTIATIDDLVQLILDDLAKSEAESPAA